LHYGKGALYGLQFTYQGEGSQVVLNTVEIDPVTGAFRDVADALVMVGGGATYDGLSGFHQKKQIFYFATDYESTFVFGVNVTDGRLRPPIAIPFKFVDTITYDSGNNQILLHGELEDGSNILVTYPDVGPSKLLLNFTEWGFGTIYSTAVDNKNGVFYFAAYNATSEGFEIGFFFLATPSKVSRAWVDCGGKFYLNHLFYDSNGGAGRLVGVGYNATAEEYFFFEIVSGKCTTKSLNLDGIIIAATYDPTIFTLYLSYTGSAIIKYNTISRTISQLPIDGMLVDVQVSYKV